MNLKDKEGFALDLIKEIYARYKRPIVYASFGKDSMVLLHLVKRAGLKFPVMFHREPFCPEKYRFANRIIEAEGLSVYDYPPLVSTMTQRGDYVEIINWHSVGRDFLYMPTGIDDRVPATICGRDDILGKPKCHYVYGWQVGLLGQKDSDKDPILQEPKIGQSIHVHSGSADFAYPIRYFTDADIWEYTRQNRIPYHEARYNSADFFKEFEDRTYNPDYFPVCVNCLRKGTGPRVYCFRERGDIDSISNLVPFIKPEDADQGPKAAIIGG